MKWRYSSGSEGRRLATGCRWPAKRLSVRIDRTQSDSNEQGEQVKCDASGPHCRAATSKGRRYAWPRGKGNSGVAVAGVAVRPSLAARSAVRLRGALVDENHLSALPPAKVGH